jgi:signal recognition particle receptor subunit beta
MVQINFASREVSVKIVYYGPGRCGKTTNLEQINIKAPPDSKGELISIATETDRTLFFDFLPLDLGKIAGMTTKFQLYTVPGQVYYNATRKLVLQGADGVVFVADSAPNMREENIESLENLVENLEENGLSIEEMPIVFQWNKRDLPNAMPVEQMNADLNRWNAPTCEAIAVKGEGVFKTLKLLASLVIKKLNREHGFAEDGKTRIPAGAPAAAAQAAPARPAPPPVAAAARPAAQAAPPARPPVQPPARPAAAQPPAVQPLRLAGTGPQAGQAQPQAPARSVPQAATAAHPARPAVPTQPERPAASAAAKAVLGQLGRPAGAGAGAAPAQPASAGTAHPTHAAPSPVHAGLAGKGGTNPLSLEIRRRKEEALARQQAQVAAQHVSGKSAGKSKAPVVIIILLLLAALAGVVYWYLRQAGILN